LTCVAPAQVLALARQAAAWARRHSWGLLLLAALLVSGGMYAGGVALLRRRAGGEAGRAAHAAIARSSLPAAAPGSVQARRSTAPAELGPAVSRQPAPPSRSAYLRLRPPAVQGRVRRGVHAGRCSAAACGQLPAHYCSASGLLWACAGTVDICQIDRLCLPPVLPGGLPALACQAPRSLPLAGGAQRDQGECIRRRRPACGSTAVTLAPAAPQARCAAATGVPKVALLLLTRGSMPHEAAWALWFEAAGGEVPLSALRAGGCSARAYADVASACRADPAAPSAIGNQHMFSIYVHTPPDFAGTAGLPGCWGHAHLQCQSCSVPARAALPQHCGQADTQAAAEHAAGRAVFAVASAGRPDRSLSWARVGASIHRHDRGALHWQAPRAQRCLRLRVRGRNTRGQAVAEERRPRWPRRPAPPEASRRVRAGFPRGSLFHGREVPAHLNATWGGHALVDASKALLRAALGDPANAKLALLSEADIPLYPPALVYQQLISEPRSRVDACLHTVRPGAGAAPGAPAAPRAAACRLSVLWREEARL